MWLNENETKIYPDYSSNLSHRGLEALFGVSKSGKP